MNVWFRDLRIKPSLKKCWTTKMIAFLVVFQKDLKNKAFMRSTEDGFLNLI